MTSIRFVGALPLWAGIGIALLMGFMAWRLYRRESFDLPGQLRWLLPVLRGLACLMGIMIFTGPVLHHRKTVGELGRVQVYLDGSRSMAFHDTHMPVSRKLLYAEQQGWIEQGSVDTSLLNAAQKLRNAVRSVEQLDSFKSLDAESAGRDSDQSVADLASALVENIESSVGPLGDSDWQLVRRSAAADATLPELDYSSVGVDESVIKPLRQTAGSSEATGGQPVDAFREAVTKASQYATALEQAYEQQAVELAKSNSESVQAALTSFDLTTRWDRATLGLTEGPSEVLDTLRETHDVDVRTLDSSEAVALPANATNSDASDDEIVFPQSPRTDLSSGIQSSQSDASVAEDRTERAASGRNAVVLFTDGRHNNGPSPIELARVLGEQGVAFFPIAMGDERPSPDLAVIATEAPDLVFEQDLVRGSIRLKDDMPPGKPFAVEILHDGEAVWREQLTTEGLGERRVEFEFGVEDLVENLRPSGPGEVKKHSIPINLVASVAPLEEEGETDNNSRTMRMAVITEAYKSLLIDGRSRWETRYLRNVFGRDNQWKIETIIAGPGTANLELPRGEADGRFPDRKSQLFEYDLILLGDVPLDLFQAHEFEWLREFVSVRGGGLILIDGLRGHLRKATQDDLEEMLPVRWADDPVTQEVETFLLTEAGQREPALRVESTAEANRDLWEELPPPHTVIATEALSDATSLLEVQVGERTLPAIVTRRYGAGRVLYFAFDETWRWRYKMADTYHQRIWNQIAKMAMPRPYAASDDYISVDTGALSYQNGDAVDIRVELRGIDGLPVADSTVDAILWRDGQRAGSVSLYADPGVPGVYRGRTGTVAPGDYEVSVQASGFQQSALKARSEFHVLEEDLGELTETASNYELLRDMAAASGGEFLTEEQVGKLKELLKPFSDGYIVESETLIWQTYWWFLTMVALLTLEWWLRKRAGLL